MVKQYAIDEMVHILGLKADKITQPLERYERDGILAPSMDAAGFKSYSSLAMYLILKDNFNSSHGKKSIIEKRGTDYAINKKSLEALVKAAKAAGAENIFGEVEKAASDKGSGYKGKIRYFFKPAKGVEISYEQTYAVDHPREADEIRAQVCEELRKITGKENIPSQLL